MEGALLATWALSLSGADAGAVLCGLAAGGSGVDHFGGLIWYDVGFWRSRGKMKLRNLWVCEFARLMDGFLRNDIALSQDESVWEKENNTLLLRVPLYCSACVRGWVVIINSWTLIGCESGCHVVQCYLSWTLIGPLRKTANRRRLSGGTMWPDGGWAETRRIWLLLSWLWFDRQDLDDLCCWVVLVRLVWGGWNCLIGATTLHNLSSIGLFTAAWK